MGLLDLCRRVSVSDVALAGFLCVMSLAAFWKCPESTKILTATKKIAIEANFLKVEGI